VIAAPIVRAQAGENFRSAGCWLVAHSSRSVLFSFYRKRKKKVKKGRSVTALRPNHGSMNLFSSSLQNKQCGQMARLLANCVCFDLRSNIWAEREGNYVGYWLVALFCGLFIAWDDLFRAAAVAEFEEDSRVPPEKALKAELATLVHSFDRIHLAPPESSSVCPPDVYLFDVRSRVHALARSSANRSQCGVLCGESPCASCGLRSTSK